LILEYSLDGSVWQSSNVFTSLTTGIYTLYVRDQLGCSFNKDFEVKEFSNNDITIPVPFVYISKSNPIRYAKRDGKNNDDSLLSYEYKGSPKWCEKQQWLNTDIVTTQFKSNFETNTVNIIKSNGTIDVIFPNKMSYNRDIKDKRDARVTDVNGDLTKTGIYFTAGDTYNYDTDAVTGTYALNGALPEWGVIGNYFKIGSIWYLIEEIFFDVVKQANVLVVTLNYVANPSPIVVSTIYDRQNYEIYEFDVDFSAYNNTDIQVEVVHEDLNYTTQSWLSEKQQIRSTLPDLLEIRYYNTDNTDIFYATGFRGLIRIPFDSLKAKTDGETDTHKTDTNVFLLDAVEYELDELIIKGVTKEIARKIVRILSHEVVGINEIGYVLQALPTIDGLGFSNIYNLTALMTKTGNVYNAVVSTDDEISTAPPIDIPNLVITENGFISY